jgi:hypothetical protein
MIIIESKLKTYIAKCPKHQIWDCTRPECQKDLFDIIDRMGSDLRNSEGLNPTIHCSVSKGIGKSFSEKKLDRIG